MNVNDIYLNGINFTRYAEGIDDLTVTYKTNENGILGYGTSSIVQFTKEAYDYLYAYFFADPCSGKDAKITVSLVVRSCCDEPVTFDFVIDFEGVTLNRLECIIEAELKWESPCQSNYEYLRDHEYWANGFEDAYEIPKIWYAVQPKNLVMWLWLMATLFPLLVLISAWKAAILTILGILESIADFFGLGGIEAALNEAQDQINQNVPSIGNLLFKITGLGNFHYAPYLFDIFEHNVNQSNAAGSCTLTLSAPILESAPYSETALFSAPTKQGDSCTLATDPNKKFKEDNAYNRTATQLAEEIALVFNQEFRILPDGTFLIDSYENIVNNAPFIINAEQQYLKGNAEEAPKYRYITNNYCYSSRYTYSEDSLDREGNRLLSWQYSENVIWDETGGSEGDGVCTKTFPFGAARFMFDAESANNEGLEDADLFIDRIRSGDFGWLSGFASGVINIVAPDLCFPRTDDLILEDHTCSLPKLLVLEPGTDVDDAKTVRVPMGGDFFHYNHVMYLQRESEPLSNGETLPLAWKELIQNFHETDDPNHPDYRLIEMLDFTVGMTAAQLSLINTQGNHVGIFTDYGKGIPEQIVLDFGRCAITYTGTKLKCSRFIP